MDFDASRSMQGLRLGQGGLILGRDPGVANQHRVLLGRCRQKGRIGEIRDGHPSLEIKVVVPVTSLCPCSKKISDYGAHNQRSHVTVTAKINDFVWLEELIDMVEQEADIRNRGAIGHRRLHAWQRARGPLTGGNGLLAKILRLRNATIETPRHAMTELLQPDAAGVARAAELIRAGELVAFPTETVYGLAADATNGEAVARILEDSGMRAETVSRTWQTAAA